jgi:glycosyltransferase involved in cell wall biosynthesis
MKVIHINDKLEVSGGVEVYLRDAIPIQRSLGIEAYWVALRRDGSDVEVLSADTSLVWRGTLGELLNSPLASLVDDQTLFHVHSISEPSILRQLFKIAPVVRHMHEPRMLCPGQGKFWATSEKACTKPFGAHCLLHAYTERCCNRHPKRLFRQFQNTRFEINEAAKQYAALISNSSYIEDEALAVGLPQNKLTVIPYFTDITPEPDWDAVPDPVITFAGRLSRTKGVHYLLDAFSQVIKEIPQAKLEILGSGHDEQIFRRQVDQLRLGDAVRFHGWVDKATIDAHLTQAAVVAFPSIYPEAFGISGIEAMMRGKPVVAFDVGGVTDWLQHQKTGYAVPVKDSDAFARGLLRILSNQELRTAMGRSARASSRELFNPSAHFSKLHKLYGSILS